MYIIATSSADIYMWPSYIKAFPNHCQDVYIYLTNILCCLEMDCKNTVVLQNQYLYYIAILFRYNYNNVMMPLSLREAVNVATPGSPSDIAMMDTVYSRPSFTSR